MKLDTAVLGGVLAALSMEARALTNPIDHLPSVPPRPPGVLPLDDVLARAAEAVAFYDPANQLVEELNGLEVNAEEEKQEEPEENVEEEKHEEPEQEAYSKIVFEDEDEEGDEEGDGEDGDDLAVL